MTHFSARFAALAVAASLAVMTGTLAATATPAYAAGTGGTTAAVRVSYGDLNLETAAGLRRFDARIRAAADRLCVPNGLTTLRERLAAEACRDDATAAAVPQVLRVTKAQPAETILIASAR